MSSFPYKRIVVIGSTGSGKSTLAENIANQFGYAYIELDALHWEPNWTDAPVDVFKERIVIAMQADDWVVAGNYSSARSLIWPNADAVIWLDYPFLLTFRQLITRTFKRWWYHEHLWGTNYESLWKHLKLWSDDSLINWLFKTYWRRKREYPVLLSKPENGHLRVFHFHTPQETAQWIENLK